MEHRLLRYQLKQEKIENAAEIYMIEASWSDSFAPAMYYDEFGIPFSVTRLILWEINPSYLNNTVIAIKPENVSTLKSGDILIDMRKLKDIQYENK